MMKGELVRASDEVIRLDAHVALLKKCNDRLEKCNELKATITAFLCTGPGGTQHNNQ